MGRKMTNRDKQALATKQRIYQCGVDLMSQHGYENITVEQIAKKANTSIGTFYHYFQSKFDLLGEVYRLGDVFFQEHTPELLDKYENCAERIVAYFCLYAQLSIDGGLGKTRSLYVPTNTMFLTHGRAMQDLLTKILRQGQERGEIIDTIAPEIMTEKLFIVARGIIFDWCLHEGKSDLMVDMRDIIGRQAQSYSLMVSQNK